MIDERTPFWEAYNLSTEEYVDLKIEELSFSNRLRNRLFGKNIFSVAELLKWSEKDLKSIQGLGKNCYDEVHNLCRELQKQKRVEQSNKITITKELLPYVEAIKQGDFSVIDSLKLSEPSKYYIEYIKQAYLLIEQELIDECIDGTREIFELLSFLERFVNAKENQKIINGLIDAFKENRLSLNVKMLINAYTDDEDLKGQLAKGMEDSSITLKDYILCNDEKIVAKDKRLMSFINWCNFDVPLEVTKFFSEISKDERLAKVVEMRSSGCTLEQLGGVLEVTRERARQIEAKISKKFVIWQRNHRVFNKLMVDQKEPIALTAAEVSELAGEYGIPFTYFLKINEFDNISYDKQLDTFILEDSSLVDRIQAYIDSLPDTFTEAKANTYLSEAENDLGYPSKMVLALLEDNYNKTGVTYHRSRLTLEKLYPEVIRRFYPEGMHIYDEAELDKFRDLVKNEYGIELNQANRSISAIIGRTCILCGRGRYKAKDKKLISKSLAKRIYEYIENSHLPVFMTNMIFNVFEDELVAENIDNKYYLQGILHELYGDRWTFRRDYVAKDESVTSMYSGIIGYIKKSAYPVRKQELYEAFPGITEIVLTLATSDKSIMNLFGEYIHVSHLKLSDNDIKYLHSILKNYLNMKPVCHCGEIYDYVNLDNPVLLKNNFVKYQFCMFSLLEYLFGEQYNFSRPFVSKMNVKIDRAYDVLREMVGEFDEIDISEITDFARDYHFQIASILEFIDSCNDTHLLVNTEKLMKIESTGVTREIVSVLEDLIIKELCDTKPIIHLQCLFNLPKINIQWNEWLVYSVLKKWSDKLEVAASSNQFRHSTPLVALSGQLSKLDININVSENTGSMVMADDLSDIDTLIADYVLDDFSMEDF